MKVLILHQDIAGGTKNATEAIIKELKTEFRSHQFIVYKQPDPIIKGRLRYTRHLIWSIWDFYRYLNKKSLKNVDCIYFNIYSCAIAKLFSKHKKTPSFFHFHGNQEFVKDLEAEKDRSLIGKIYNKLLGKVVIKLQRSAFEYSEKICFVSNLVKKEFLKQQLMENFLYKTIVLPNGVDFSIFFPTTKKEKNKFLKRFKFTNKETKIIMYSGRIDEKKGISKIVFALKKYKKNDLHLLIVHPQPREKQSIIYKKWLEQTIKINSLEKNVHFFENPANITPFYQISDLVLLPSDREYFSLVLLESFACGTPFIGSKVGFIPEFLRKIDKRLILEKNTAQEISQKLKWFFTLSHQEQIKIAQKGLEVSQKFDWKNISHEIFNELKKLTKN